MQTQINEDRPPYVTFETKAVETVDEKGHPIVKDVTYAYITPQGSKDRMERVAEDWFVQLRNQTSQGRFKREWLQHFEATFKAYKEDMEPPLNGTDIRHWPVATPSQVKQLRNVRILTVEDLAGANEAAISMIGMGGRTLVQKAQDWLKGSKDIAPMVQELAALKLQNQELTKRNDEQSQQIADLLTVLRKANPDLLAQPSTQSDDQLEDTLRKL